MPDAASFRSCMPPIPGDCRPDPALLPSRVRRSDDLQRNRAEEAMIRRSASAGSVLRVANRGNPEMARAAAIDARGARDPMAQFEAKSASNSFKSNSGSKTGSPLVGACRDVFGLNKLPAAADAPKRRRRRRKGGSDSEEGGSEEEHDRAGPVPPPTTAQSATADQLLNGVAARAAARSAQPG